MHIILEKICSRPLGADFIAPGGFYKFLYNIYRGRNHNNFAKIRNVKINTIIGLKIYNKI